MIISWKEKLAYDLSKISAVKFSILYYLSMVISWKEKLAFDLSKISAVKFFILYYLSLVLSSKEKLAYDPSKISAVKFSILYFLSLVISWKEKLHFDLTSLSFSPSLCTALPTRGTGNPIPAILVTSTLSDSVSTGQGSGKEESLGGSGDPIGGKGDECRRMSPWKAEVDKLLLKIQPNTLKN